MTYDRKIYFTDEPNAAPQPGNQRWKTDPALHSCERIEEKLQSKKMLDYYDVYVDEFLNKDPIRDWESIERCIALWQFFLLQIEPFAGETSILDCGTKDGQFPEWLNKQGFEVLGIEISDAYVNWAQNHHRPVEYGDVCDMPPKWTDKFDVVFAHHLLGLVPDYWLGLTEMYRVTKPGGYLVTLNDVPGNPRKHYSYIGGPDIFEAFTHMNKCDMIYSGPWNQEMPKEYVYIVKK